MTDEEVARKFDRLAARSLPSAGELRDLVARLDELPSCASLVAALVKRPETAD